MSMSSSPWSPLAGFAEVVLAKYVLPGKSPAAATVAQSVVDEEKVVTDHMAQKIHEIEAPKTRS